MALPTVVVPGTTMPWNFISGRNSSFPYSINDGTAPIIACQNLKQGQAVSFKYVSGTVVASSGRSAVDANGDSSSPSPVNANLGPSGTFYPSKYIDPGSYPINLICLVGCFTDKNGSVVGTPFKIGNGSTTVNVPAGAYQIQIGANDDHFGDNTGSWTIQVTATSVCFVASPKARAQLGPAIGVPQNFVPPTEGQGWPLSSA